MSMECIKVKERKQTRKLQSKEAKRLFFFYLALRIPNAEGPTYPHWDESRSFPEKCQYKQCIM